MIFFNIDNWVIWDINKQININNPNIKQGQAKPDNLPGMLKRRMPPLAKATYMAENMLDQVHLPTIYASKHAELSRTIGLIKQFGRDLSPMNFSMSVHNFIPGLISVIQKNNQPYTVIDSLSGIFESALFEAFTWLSSYDKVRIVYFEEQTCQIINDTFMLNDQAMVVAMDISRGQQWQLDFEYVNEKVSESTDIHLYAELLVKKIASLTVSSRNLKWTWRNSLA